MAIDLQQLPDVWPAESLTRSRTGTLPSGDPRLDEALGGGWPTPALIEILIDQYGIGELTLMLPLLRSLMDARPDTLTLWINPPHAVHAVALLQQDVDPARHWVTHNLNERDAAWTFEVALRSGTCNVVIGWLNHPAMAVLRRLKLATSTGGTTGLLFRPGSAANSPSPATIRMALTSQSRILVAHFLKIQGRRPATLAFDLRSRIGREPCP